MTQKHVQISAYAVLMILGVSTAWAEVGKERAREILPAPRCCCEQSESVASGCCAAAKEGSSCCAKQNQNVAVNCCKGCDIEHWLQTACPLDITLKIVVDEPTLSDAGMFVLGMKGTSFGNLLSTLLHQVHLTYAISDNVLKITEEAQAGDKIVSKIYPVGNLVSPAEPIILPLADGDVFFGWSTRTPAGLRLLDDTPEEALMNLIMSAIKPQSWNENGGSGTIDYVPVSKSLVVSQTPEIHEQIEDFLAALGRLQQQESSACAPAPFQHMPMPMLAPNPPSPAPPVAMAPPMPPFFHYIVPPAFAPVPPPPPVGAIPPVERHPEPARAHPPRTYTLQAIVMQRTEHGKKELHCQRIDFRPERCFHGQITTACKGGDQCQTQWTLHVKATALKNERLHLEVIGIQAKAENTSNGEVALAVSATPLVDRQVKLGKTMKRVLEEDEAGRPCKWVELTVKEMQQGPVGAVWPPAVEETTTAFLPAVSCPLESISASPAAFQPGHPAMMRSATIFQVVDAPPENEGNHVWRIRSVALEGKTRLIMRQGDQDSLTVNALEIRIPGNDCLKLSSAGEQVCARNASMEAQADAVSSTGHAGCFLFEGHVSLVRKKDGACEHVAAERVLVNLADGHLELFQAGN